MKISKRPPADNINISNVTKELMSAVMKMNNEEKFAMLRKQAGQEHSFSAYFNPKTITKQVIEMITKMSVEDKCKLLGDLKTSKGLSRRQFVRKEYVTPVNFVVKGIPLNGYTKNISKGGVFIDTNKAAQYKFAPGDPVTMNFDHPQVRRYIKITGKIAHVSAKGIGICFDEYL